ncbi:MAG: DUF370 domain-containing protein [Ruminiclostridium sp.]|jgi:regulator of extracellular matrix RemA (YlzA/DUF370 family)|nr:DUF370 domain-containing protein [Ruminiclostridium sp.]
MRLLDIGFGNMINSDRVIALVSADAAPTKRIISAAREKNLAVDATCGKKTKSVFIMDSGHVVLSAKTPDRLGRIGSENKEDETFTESEA